MPIPALNQNGELAAGEHDATLDEVEKTFGSSTERRIELMRLLRLAATNLAEAGVKKIWIDGSFTTDKQSPNDIDGCWDYDTSVNLDILDPVFQVNSTQPMKEKYGLDFYVAQIIEASIDKPFPFFFQINRDGEAKGIVTVKLEKPA
jgi:hypothetical protein